MLKGKEQNDRGRIDGGKEEGHQKDRRKAYKKGGRDRNLDLERKRKAETKTAEVKQTEEEKEEE